MPSLLNYASVVLCQSSMFRFVSSQVECFMSGYCDSQLFALVLQWVTEAICNFGAHRNSVFLGKCLQALRSVHPKDCGHTGAPTLAALGNSAVSALCILMASKWLESTFHPECFKQNDNAVFRWTMTDFPMSCLCPENSAHRPTTKYLQPRLHLWL